MTLSYILAILATIAGSAMALSNIFQAVKIFKRKSALDVSIFTSLILTIGEFIWIAYGFSINNFPVIISNSIGTVITIIIVIGCLLYGNKK